jgi:hypothetical protein
MALADCETSLSFESVLLLQRRLTQDLDFPLLRLNPSSWHVLTETLLNPTNIVKFQSTNLATRLLSNSCQGLVVW